MKCAIFSTGFLKKPDLCSIIVFLDFSFPFSRGNSIEEMIGERCITKEAGQTISATNPVLSVLTHMAEDTRNPQTSPPTQNIPNTRRDMPRHHGNRRPHNYREHAPRPAAEQPAEKTQETKELSLDDEETEQDRSAAPSRQSRGGGRGKPPKRIIEEWANDIYCE